VCLPFHSEPTVIAGKKKTFCSAMLQSRKPATKYKGTRETREKKEKKRSTKTTYQAAAATVVLSQEKAKFASAAIAVRDGLVVLPGGVLLFRFLQKLKAQKLKAQKFEA
jgi:hypothetical protein